MHRISIVTPLYNAAGTVARAIDSCLKQTHAPTEILIVDNGSTDGSLDLVRAMSHPTIPIHVLTEGERGAAAARNSGIRAAIGDWIVFLDSDDELPPDHLAIMLAASDAAPAAGLLYCGWRRLRDGTPWWTVHDAVIYDDPVAVTRRSCPFAIHAVMIRQDALLAANLFDTNLEVCEDWDLWRKIALSGTSFAAVPERHVDVHVTGGSLSSDTGQFLTDAMTVIRRGHAHDDDEDLYRDSLWSMALWLAGAAIGRSEDVAALLARIDTPIPATLNPHLVANLVEDGMVVGAFRPDPQWPELWHHVHKGLSDLVRWLDRACPERRLGQMVQAILSRRVAVLAAGKTNMTLANVHVQTFDLKAPLPNLDLPGVDRLIATITFEGRPQGSVELLLFGGISGRQLAREVVVHCNTPDLTARMNHARRFEAQSQHLLGQYRLARRIVRICRKLARKLSGAKPQPIVDLPLADLIRTAPGATDVIQASDRISTIIAEETAQAAIASGHKAAVRAVRTGPDVDEVVDYTQESYWEGIFSSKDPWDYRNNYEALKYDQTIALLGDRRFARALEIACAEGEFTARLVGMCDEIVATDIAPSAVARAAEKLAHFPQISCARLDLLTEEPDGDFDLIVCSEVLYYLEDPQTLHRFVDRVSRRLRPGGCFITAHANLLVDEPERTGFDWPHHYGAKGIGDAFDAHPDLQPEAEFWTPLYRIQRFVKSEAPVSFERIIGDTAQPLPAQVAAQVKWHGRTPAASSPTWHDFPVLMYHRIADDGPAALAQWRTGVDAFAQQLTWLRDNGWHGISLSRLHAVFSEGQALPNKSVILTFDDGTTDFIENALPLLHRFGFPTALFVPTGKVGGSADWDSDYGPPAPLMNWDTLRALRHSNVTIGSHSVSHQRLTSLDAEAIVRELARSKAQLAYEMERDITTIAYPFGDFDTAIRNTAEICGYRLGFTCVDGLNGRDADGLTLRRQEVRGGISLDAFSRLLAP